MEKLKEIKQNLDYFKNQLADIKEIPALGYNYNVLVYEPVTDLLKELGLSEEKPHPFIELDTEKLTDPDCQTC